MLTQYRIALPHLVIEGRALPTRNGTGVSVMTALAYLQCWDPDAVVAIYPADGFDGAQGPLAHRVDAALLKASTRAWQVVLLGTPATEDDVELESMIVCARVSVLWSLARLAQPALMELLDAFVPLVDLEEEDEALALISQCMPSIDLVADILRPFPDHLLTMLPEDDGRLEPVSTVRARRANPSLSLSAIAL